MPRNKKRKRVERPTIHPRNKYSDKPPDFQLLASLYPSFHPYVFCSRDGRPRIDWTDYNATRELTRVLLLHDYGINWWLPDGQLCPTVPNRSNYIHWIEDLLSSDILAHTCADNDTMRGFDIGTGASCIYPLLGASLFGWSFVGSDITDVALAWAEKNVRNNPHISKLIEIRKAETKLVAFDGEDLNICQPVNKNSVAHSTETRIMDMETSTCSVLEVCPEVHESYFGPPVLLGVVKDGEIFDFCMCNPPFFETMEKAGLNPKTSCGGTEHEMVCPGGEQAFINRIIEDSLQLKQSFRWFTSMVGRKSNLKLLISKLRKAAVTIVKTTEFVQGQTSRWGLAWSFMPAARKIVSSCVVEKCALSFMLEVTASKDHCDTILKCHSQMSQGNAISKHDLESSSCSLMDLRFCISVFEQIPGTLLIKVELKEGLGSGTFSLIFQQLETVLRKRFCREKGGGLECYVKRTNDDEAEKGGQREVHTSK